MDLLSNETLWELKCTSKITQEHQLQVVIYTWLWNILHKDSPRKVILFNIRTEEKQIIRAKMSDLTKIVVALLENKYNEQKPLNDEQFLAKCDEIKDKYT